MEFQCTKKIAQLDGQVSWPTTLGKFLLKEGNNNKRLQLTNIFY